MDHAYKFATLLLVSIFFLPQPFASANAGQSIKMEPKKSTQPHVIYAPTHADQAGNADNTGDATSLFMLGVQHTKSGANWRSYVVTVTDIATSIGNVRLLQSFDPSPKIIPVDKTKTNNCCSFEHSICVIRGR